MSGCYTFSIPVSPATDFTPCNPCKPACNPCGGCVIPTPCSSYSGTDVAMIIRADLTVTGPGAVTLPKNLYGYINALPAGDLYVKDKDGTVRTVVITRTSDGCGRFNVTLAIPALGATDSVTLLRCAPVTPDPSGDPQPITL